MTPQAPSTTNKPLATPQDVSTAVGSTVKSLLSGAQVPSAPGAPPVSAPPAAPTTPVVPSAPAAGTPTPTPATPLTSAGIPDVLITKPGAAPTTPVAPAASTPPAEPVGSELSPSGSKDENMSAMRQRITDQQKIIDELNALKAQYVADDGSFKPPKELTDLYSQKDEEIKRLSHELGKVNFAASPEFQTRYQAPVDSTFQQIIELVTELGGTEGVAAQLAGATVKERLAYLKQSMPDAAGILVPMYSSLDKLLVMRNQALETHKETSVKLAQQESVQKQQQISALKNTMRDKALDSLEQEGYFMFSKVPGNEEWNGRVDAMRGAVDVLVQSEDVALQSEALAMSVAAPVYRALYEEERTARIQLEQQLGRYQTANPSAHLSGAPQSVGTAGVASGLTASGAAQAILGKIGAR